MALPLIFWSCFFLVAYTYLFYPAVLFLASSAARLWPGARVAPEAGSLPAVSLIVPNLMFEELEIQKVTDVLQKPPVVPSPLRN